MTASMKTGRCLNSWLPGRSPPFLKRPAPGCGSGFMRRRERCDSVGGIVECCAVGMPAGLGSPDFGCNVEGIVSQYLFAVPAVKAVAFGAGFGFASMHGSEANDPICLQNGEIRTATNHTGGVNGGITNGMPVLFSVALRPTASISQPQRTVSPVPGGRSHPGGAGAARSLHRPPGRTGH